MATLKILLENMMYFILFYSLNQKALSDCVNETINLNNRDSQDCFGDWEILWRIQNKFALMEKTVLPQSVFSSEIISLK